MTIVLSIMIGLIAGIASGLFGIGGAIVIVPMLVSLMGFGQKMAQGTVLVMFVIAPSMAAAYQYYKNGNADIKIAALLWIGVFIGSALGAWIVNVLLKDVPTASMILRKSFSLIMIFLAVKMWFS